MRICCTKWRIMAGNTATLDKSTILVTHVESFYLVSILSLSLIRVLYIKLLRSEYKASCNSALCSPKKNLQLLYVVLEPKSDLMCYSNADKLVLNLCHGIKITIILPLSTTLMSTQYQCHYSGPNSDLSGFY